MIVVHRYIHSRSRRAIAIAALSLATASTARAQQPVPTTPAASVVVRPDSILAARIAAGARPISLDDAVHLAEQRSPVVRIAANAVTRASGQQAQARSGLLPQINGSAGYTRTLASQFQNAFGSSKSSAPPPPAGPPGPCSQYIFGLDSSTAARVTGLENYARCTVSGGSSSTGGIDFSKVGFGSKNTYNIGLTGSQNLFTGGRVLGQIQAASANRQSAAIELTAQRAQLRLDVASAYYDAALSDRLLAIAQSTLQQTRDVLSQTQLQQKVGNVSEFDLLRAQVSVNTQIPVVLQRQSDRDVAYLRLKQLLSLPYEETLALTTSVEDSSTTLAGVDLTRALSPDTATSRRAPVREASEAVRAQQGQLKVARAERLPSLALSTNYGRVAYPAGGLPSWSDFRSNWTVTIGTSFPIFAGGRIHGDQLVAESNLRDAEARLQQARDVAALDTRVALNTLTQAQATLVASRGTAQQATRAYQIAEVRYREGISTQLELNDTRNQLSQALVNEAQAARNVQIARVRLALLPDLPVQTQGAGQTNLSQQQQQQQQIQQQAPTTVQAAQQQGAGAGGAPTGTTGSTTTPQSGSNQ